MGVACASEQLEHAPFAVPYANLPLGQLRSADAQSAILRARERIIAYAVHVGLPDAIAVW